MSVLRSEGTRFYEEVLERILDRGMMVDAMSRVAALSNNAPLAAQTEPVDASGQSTPTALISPPRVRDRD
jgi:hypothetical protein